MAASDFEKFFTGNGAPDRNPITAFNFVLEVEAVYFLPLRSVRAFTKKNDYESIREGGLNDYVHLRRKQATEPFTFQVERYIGTDRFLDPLANGTELLLPLILHVYRHKAMQGFGSGNLPDAWPARLFIFTGCTVMNKEYGELNAEKSALMTETTTIAYRELMVINNSLSDVIKQLGFDATALSAEKEEWRFKEASANKDKAFKDPENGRNYAARAVNDGDRAETTLYSLTDKNGNPINKEEMLKPVRGRQAENSDKRADDVKWEATGKDGKPKDKKELLKTVRGVQAENSDKHAAEVKWEATDKDGKPKNTEELLKTVRANQDENTKARAMSVKWEATDKDGKPKNEEELLKTVRANQDENTKARAMSVKWDALDKDGKAKDNKELLKTVRGKKADNSDDRADNVLWKLPDEKKKNVRGKLSENSDKHAKPVNWKMGDKSSRGKQSENSDKRATPVNWKMGDDKSRGKLSDNSDKRAKAVKWPPDRRSMTVDLLNR